MHPWGLAASPRSNRLKTYEIPCYVALVTGSDTYYERLSAKPLAITEYGIDAKDNRTGAEYEEVQSEYARRQWCQLAADTVGGSIMEYSDEWCTGGDLNPHAL